MLEIMSVEDAALALGVSEPTIKRDMRLAQAWLRRELHSEVGNNFARSRVQLAFDRTSLIFFRLSSRMNAQLANYCEARTA